MVVNSTKVNLETDHLKIKNNQVGPVKVLPVLILFFSDDDVCHEH